MATLTPTRSTNIAEEPLTQQNITTALRPWRRQLSVHQVLSWTVRGLVTGLIFAGLILLTARFLPWLSAPYWALGSGVACVIIALGIALWFRPSVASTARILDKRLGLHDRMGTAWELREQSSILARLQRRDALKQLKKHNPSTAIPLRLSRPTLLTIAVIALVLALLVFIPNSMDKVARQQAAFQAQIVQQVKNIDAARRILANQPSTTNTKKQQIDQILKDLQARLQQAQNETEAQQALAQAQSALDQLRNLDAGNQIQGQTAAGNSLQNSTDPSLQNVGSALSNNNGQSLSKALQDLASQAANMSAAQRAQLAKQLEQASSQAAAQNANLSSALHQLAKAVADGSASEITDATGAVEAAQSQTAAAAAQNNAVNQASQSLQQAANNLASATDNSATKIIGQDQGQGQQGQGQGQQAQGPQGQGQQDQNQSGQGQGQSQGQQGQGQGQGQGQNGQGQGQGQGGQGGSNSAGNNSGKNEQVYVPGKTGSGTSTQSADGTSAVQSGSSVPYSQVVQQYNQAAHDAVDNSNIPPDEKGLVHDYFNSLAGQ